MKSVLKKWAALFGLDILRRDAPMALVLRDQGHMGYALARGFRSLQGLRFLQVGANDGRRNDPICRHIDEFAWSGVFIEPDPDMMALLRVHRQGPRFKFIDRPLAEQGGRLVFYAVEGEDLPDFSSGLGTLSRERIEQAAQDLREWNPRIVERPVDCLGVGELVEQYGRSFDVCVIDVEGLDYRILRMLAEAGALARVVHYEHKCLSEDERQASFSLLLARGYRLLVGEDDCTAYRLAEGGVPHGRS